MNKILFCSVMLIMILFSCSSSTQEQGSDEIELSPGQQQVRDLEIKVLDIHDAVMPLLATLVSFKDQLKTKNQLLMSSDHSNAYDQVILNNLVITNLDQAHEEMMNWMRNYHRIDITADAATNLSYLEEQKSKIEYVQDQVNSAIKSAQEALAESQT